MAQIRVHLAPSLLEPEELFGRVAIVIDLLRASSTIVAALAAGAARVIPCEEIDEAKAIQARLGNGSALLGGERCGHTIPGFDLGNGPHEYTRERLAGPPAKAVVFTTTNGTRLIRRASRADTVLVACLMNLNAAAAFALHRTTGRQPSDERRDISILCAGVHGQPCLEDVLCAGALADQLAQGLGASIVDDSAQIAVSIWKSLPVVANSRTRGLLDAITNSCGGRTLIAAGLANQISQCAVMNSTHIVPMLSPSGDLLRAPVLQRP
jgi:2-phosphosulfolactate phosphatase